MVRYKTWAETGHQQVWRSEVPRFERAPPPVGVRKEDAGHVSRYRRSLSIDISSCFSQLNSWLFVDMLKSQLFIVCKSGETSSIIMVYYDLLWFLYPSYIPCLKHAIFVLKKRGWNKSIRPMRSLRRLRRARRMTVGRSRLAVSISSPPEISGDIRMQNQCCFTAKMPQ